MQIWRYQKNSPYNEHRRGGTLYICSLPLYPGRKPLTKSRTKIHRLVYSLKNSCSKKKGEGLLLANNTKLVQKKMPYKWYIVSPFFPLAPHVTRTSKSKELQHLAGL